MLVSLVDIQYDKRVFNNTICRVMSIHEIKGVLVWQVFRGKEILEQLSKPRFLRSLKTAPFSSVLIGSVEEPAIFELRKKFGFET